MWLCVVLVYSDGAGLVYVPNGLCEVFCCQGGAEVPVVFWFGLPTMYYTLLDVTPSLSLSLFLSFSPLPFPKLMGGTITCMYTVCISQF